MRVRGPRPGERARRPPVVAGRGPLLLGLVGPCRLFRRASLHIEPVGIGCLQSRSFDLMAAREGLDLTARGLLLAEVDRDQCALAADGTGDRFRIGHLASTVHSWLCVAFPSVVGESVHRRTHGAQVRSRGRRGPGGLRTTPRVGLRRRRPCGRGPRRTLFSRGRPFPSASDPQAARIGRSPRGADAARRNDRRDLFVDPTSLGSHRTAEASGRRLGGPGLTTAARGAYGRRDTRRTPSSPTKRARWTATFSPAHRAPLPRWAKRWECVRGRGAS